MHSMQPKKFMVLMGSADQSELLWPVGSKSMQKNIWLVRLYMGFHSFTCGEFSVFTNRFYTAWYNICRLGSFGREHASVKEKPHKKDKDKQKEKSGKDKSPYGNVLLRSSFSWDSSQGLCRYFVSVVCRNNSKGKR